MRGVLDIRPFDAELALKVFRALDVNDAREIDMMRSEPHKPLDLLAMWQAAAPYAFLSLVASRSYGGELVPFAVIALSHGGAPGMAVASLLARDHRAFRPELAALAVKIRREIRHTAHRVSVHRIEARAWAGHPTAPGMLTALRFVPEADLPGHGPDPTTVYRQFAWYSAAVPHPPKRSFENVL